MNLQLPSPNLVSPPQGERWLRTLLESIGNYLSHLKAQLNFLTMDPQARVSGTDPLGSLVASETLTLTSSIQVIRSPLTLVEIKYLYPPAGQMTMRGIVHLILTHDGTTNYKLIRVDGATGNLKLQTATMTVTNGNKDQTLSLIYDGEFWYPMVGQKSL
jgi:hypothetical protein